MAGEQERTNFAHGQDVLTLLNRDMANEMNTALMYLMNSLAVRGADAMDIQETMGTFADQDLSHVRLLAGRIVELEGDPELTPAQIQNNASREITPVPRHADTKRMLRDALESEMQSVVEYRNQVQTLAFNDPTTRLLLEGILADKEHQTEQIRNLLGV